MSIRQVVVVVCCLAATAHARGQEGEAGSQPHESPGAATGGATSNSDLAKKLTNPISDLASIPLQFNWNEGVGPNHDLQMVLNVQPVVPVSLTEDWNLIARFILPFVSQPSLARGAPPVFGLSDVVFSLFLSPNKQTGFIWGLGPVFGLPMSTDPLLGSGQWQVGPTGVALLLDGPWTAGLLANQLWSFVDTGDINRRAVSQTFIQPFVSHTSESSVTATVTTETTIDWEARGDERFTVPVYLQLSKVTQLGPFPLNAQVGVGYYLAGPSRGPDWALRLAFTVLLPKHPKKEGSAAD